MAAKLELKDTTLLENPTSFSVSYGVIISRLIGWLGLGVWLGSLVATRFFFVPAIISSLEYIPLLVRHDDWKARIATYAQVQSFNQVDLIGIFCVLALSQAAWVQFKVWRGRRFIAYIPLAISAGLFGLLVHGVNDRLDLSTTAGPGLVAMLDRTNQLMLVEISLLAILTVFFGFMPHSTAIVDED